MSEDRELILSRLLSDIVGPKFGEEEEIDERPSQRYLTGILFPQNINVSENEEEENNEVQSKSEAGQNNENKAVALFRATRPATAGISFAVINTEEKVSSISIEISGARYESVEKKSWKRIPLNSTLPSTAIDLRKNIQKFDLDKFGIEGLEIYIKTTAKDGKDTVTVQLINASDANLEEDPLALEKSTFFQMSMRVKCDAGSEFVARPLRSFGNDEDSLSAALIFRDCEEYATGHTCSAFWQKDAEGKVPFVEIDWTPKTEVKNISAEGDPIFLEMAAKTKIGEFSAGAIAKASRPDVLELLFSLTKAYELWIEQQKNEILSTIDPNFQEQGKENLKRCSEALERINTGIKYLENDPVAFKSFRLANKAMQIQKGWADGHPNWKDQSGSNLVWRPFQLAFALMTLPSVSDRTHEERNVLDLIWFPTGGGKTEAYLLAAVFCLMHRRLRNPNNGKGLGLGVFMRYTLRTLTVQQFERAAAVITACEVLRKDGALPELGNTPFSIGLWVGNDSTPNRYTDARSALKTNSPSTPKQLHVCPGCQHWKTKLLWKSDDSSQSVYCECPSDECHAEEPLGRIPVLTVDEEIYRNPPSLLIGTVDKFAQIVRNEKCGNLFGLNNNCEPPDLIIQDELHLISGPLGSVFGLYEVAIDEMCSTSLGKPKIIGSTATIRRAKEQVEDLFCRDSFQFPPPALSEENSCFAMKESGEDNDGRLYLGITTAGRSDKYVLQAVSASLLQSSIDPKLSEDGINAYSTLVAYFNALRSLSGALVAMQDDVPKTIEALAIQYDEEAREIELPVELTSRVSSSEIPVILEQLKIKYGEVGFKHILLASNMLSVGVDIPRLGLMVVNGQPKSMSEYIQATSRVGRSKKGPGLIITLYNNYKIRDRSYYETFLTWHNSLYRSVEPTSVTPFSPRARDKALHAPLIAMARHQLGIKSAKLSPTEYTRIREEIIPKIVSRVNRVDRREEIDTEKELIAFLDYWNERSELKHWWNDMAFKKSLLISAEKSAARKASGKEKATSRATPNSMRNVEPSVDYRLIDAVRIFEQEGDS